MFRTGQEEPQETRQSNDSDLEDIIDVISETRHSLVLLLFFLRTGSQLAEFLQLPFKSVQILQLFG